MHVLARRPGHGQRCLHHVGFAVSGSVRDRHLQCKSARPHVQHAFSAVAGDMRFI